MKNQPEFMPTRSLIYVHCAREEYRHRLQRWLYTTHIPDSISQFAPYCQKYAFYNALPVPPEGGRFGTINMQLTEHYWSINPIQFLNSTKTFQEVFPPEVLRWQGILPDVDLTPEMLAQMQNMSGDDARSHQGFADTIPFIAVFLPIWWEEDLKGKERTIADGANYRWQCLIRYPENVSMEEGDRWFYDILVPYFQGCGTVNRMLSSKVLKNINDPNYDRVMELWFDGPEEWYETVVKNADRIKAPDWKDSCAQDVFPYLKPFHEFCGIFLTDYATSDNYSQYHGYITMR